jgi:hypothetical protein
MRHVAILIGLVAVPNFATADPPRPSDNLFYVEALGKTGAYGLGYERALDPHLALGVEASYLPLRDQELATGATYIHVTPARRGRNALFGDLGVELAYSRIDSPVARWMGTTTYGGGGVASLGWEHDRGRWVTRTAVSLLAGKGGAAPWFGLTLGRR